MKTPRPLNLLVLTTLLGTACQPTTFLPLPHQAPLGIQNQTGLKINRIQTKVATPQQQVIPGEFIVKYRPGIQASQAQASLQTLGLSKLQTIGHPQMGLDLVKARPGAGMEATLRILKQDPQILFAEPNYVVSIPEVLPGSESLPQQRQFDGAPNDEKFGQQYAHQVSNSIEGWKISQGSDKITIAVVDTGVDTSHPDLAAKMVPGFDAIDNDDTPKDGHGHGTHCAGIAAAITNNKTGIAGFAPNVKVMPIRVLGDNGSGTSADVANGMIWAADHGAQVISMSLGSTSDAQVKAEAVKYALSKDVVVVAAMGNYGRELKIYPAAQAGVIAVGATDNRDQRASFSQFGPWISVTAPGVNILSTFPTYANNMNRKDYGAISGTSMATPAAAGVVALIRSQFPDMNITQVRQQLEQGTDDLGDPGYDKYYGHGRINLAKALKPAGFRH